MYVVGVNGRLCVLMDEIGCLELWSSCVDTDAMRACVVGADGHVFWRSAVAHGSCSYLLLFVSKFLAL
jgi:hypothetical protein